MTDTHPPLTWGDMKAWARDNEVPDHAVLEDQDQRKIRDLCLDQDDDDNPFLVLQRTWG